MSKNSSNMEPGPTINKKKNDKNKTSNIVPNVGDVFQPLWIRRYSDNSDEISETSKSETGRGVTDYAVAHFP